MTIEIIHGDCLGLPPENAAQFDCMITDPPYSAHVHKNATSHSGVRGARHRDLGFEHLSNQLRDQILRFAGRVKRWSVIYSDIEGFGEWCSDTNYIRGIPWVRWSMPQLSGDRPPQGAEMIALFWGSQTGRKSWNGPGNLTHLAHKALRGEGKHKCAKPLDQVLDLVSWFSNPGEVLFDACSGSGTTALAAAILGRSCIAYEISEEWAQRARDRVDAYTKFGRLDYLDDAVRYRRWLDSQKTAEEDKIRRELHTAKIRAKLDCR